MTISRVPNYPIYPTQPAGGAPRPSAPTASSPTASAAAASNGPPPLWSVLTDAERSFFLGTAALGSLGYGPDGAIARDAEAPIGQRIDVRA